MAKTLDQLPDIYNIVRSHIEANGTHYGYSLRDFDAVYASFRDDEKGREDFLQELFDSVPKKASGPSKAASK